MQNIEKRIMPSAKYCNSYYVKCKILKTYYVECKILKNVLCKVQTIEKRIMSRAKYWKTYYVKCKTLKKVICRVQNIEKLIMASANYWKTYCVKCKTVEKRIMSICTGKIIDKAQRLLDCERTFRMITGWQPIFGVISVLKAYFWIGKRLKSCILGW